MLSSGGVAPAEEAARAGAWSVLSGPAGGAVGAGLLARLSGDGNALGFDMGGTSCDVCVIEDGRVRKTDSRELDGRVIQLPMVDVHTVGAGGGSIGWRDDGGALRVGPRSAGAEPGPACYGRGGTEPTVTDANLMLGYLGPSSELAGGVELDQDAAKAAVARLADELGLEPLAAAEGIVRVANPEMVRALRVVTVERGVDPRDFALMPFGGAGPMHAAAIAAELGIERILCPRASGVLSALGLLASERRRDTARTVMLRGDELTAERIAAEVRALREGLAEGLGTPPPRSPTSCAIAASRSSSRSPATSARAPSGWPRSSPPSTSAVTATATPTARSSWSTSAWRSSSPARTRARAPPTRAPSTAGAAGPASAASGSRPRCCAGEPPAGTAAEGPCVFELPEATLVLPPGWRAEVDDAGTVRAERGR